MGLASRAIERLSLWVLLVGGLGMIIATLLGTADVVGTQFLGKPVPGALEMTESTMVLIVFGGLAYAQIRRSHIRVELLYARSGPRLRAAMDVLADVAALLFYGLLLWQAYHEAAYSIQIDEAADGLIRFPLWPARVILAAGTLLLIARLSIDLIIDVQRLLGERHDEPPSGTVVDQALEQASAGKGQ